VAQVESDRAGGSPEGAASAASRVAAAGGPAFSALSSSAAAPCPPQQVSSAAATPQEPVAAGGQASTPELPPPVQVASAPAPPEIIPFARERLTFSLYWSGVHVGTAVLEAVRGNGTASIVSTVRSNAVISAFYKVEDRAEARLVNGRPVSFTLVQSEGSHRRNKETIFDRERDKVVYVNHLDKSRNEYEMGGKTLWDVISAFYYLRRQPLEIGRPVQISMFDSNKFLNTEVRVLRRDRVEQGDGRSVASIVVEPMLNSEGLFKKEGEILIWLTDDERRLPVRMETKLKIGRVTAELKSSSVSSE
jgi:hypothetical protein